MWQLQLGGVARRAFPIQQQHVAGVVGNEQEVIVLHAQVAYRSIAYGLHSRSRPSGYRLAIGHQVQEPGLLRGHQYAVVLLAFIVEHRERSTGLLFHAHRPAVHILAVAIDHIHTLRGVEQQLQLAVPEAVHLLHQTQDGAVQLACPHHFARAAHGGQSMVGVLRKHVSRPGHMVKYQVRIPRKRCA